MTQPETRPKPSASALGVSEASLDLYSSSEVIDLHIESFSFTRSFGYDLHKRHAHSLHGALLFGQADLPRLIEAGLSGGVFSITANPLRPREDRSAYFVRLLGELLDQLSHHPKVAVARHLADYQKARAEGKWAGFIGVQGGVALGEDPHILDRLGVYLVKVCLLHLFDSPLGSTSTWSHLPLGHKRARLSSLGADYISEMNRLGILVDLAHIHEKAFFEALEQCDPSEPVISSHTGLSRVHPHWRNLSDAQVRAIAETGGVVGIIYHASFLGDPWYAGKLSTLVRHIAAAIDLVGDDFVALGSDWDGLICPPRDMPTCLELPRIVDAMLAFGIPERSIPKILGGNFLRVLGAIEPRRQKHLARLASTGAFP